jgi:hypothetical protein
VAKHPPMERSSNSNGGVASANEPNDHDGKASANEPSDHGGRASANEPSDHGGKASAKKQARTLSVAKHLPERGPIAAKHPLVMTSARSSAVGQPIAVEHMKARQAQLGASPATDGMAEPHRR